MRKKILTVMLAVCVAVCAVALSACKSEIEIIADSNPYTFTNKEHAKPEMDEGMVIDGKFDEARWQSSRWLRAQDTVNAQLYADISFTTSIGEKGVYFGMEIQEHGSYIYYNPQRASYMNSCIEMYAAPVIDGTAARDQIMEFDFHADGTTTNRLNTAASGNAQWVDKVTVWEKSPVSASTILGGKINDTATGYTVEAFIPFTFLDFCDWDVSDPESMVFGIDPVHIFSFNYDGTDTNQDRFWSQWSANQGYIDAKWLTPETFFRFGKSGLIAYDLDVTYGGTGGGLVTTAKGLPLLDGVSNTIYVKPRNNASVTKFEVNGEDKRSELAAVGGYYAYKLGVVTENVEVSADFE